jgi:hypothetical protein
MKKALHITLAALAATSMLPASPVVHASGGSCLPRTLTPAEKQAGERVVARLRPLLPPAPAGWRIDGPDAIDIASGSCLDATTHKSMPQPVSAQVRRTFVREGPAPTAAPVNMPPAATPAPDPQVRARARTLEQQIAELKRQQQAASDAYTAARRAGDGAGVRAAQAQGREVRRAMDVPLKELMEIRKAERLRQQAENAARHEATVAQNKQSLANRRIAHVTLNTNSGRALARASRPIVIPGTALAISQPGFSTSLLFGKGWQFMSNEAYRPWDPSAPLSRVQDVNVRVDGNDEVMQALIGSLDLKALDAIIER